MDSPSGVQPPDEVPPFAMLVFPPFPKLRPEIVTINHWSNGGLYVVQPEPSQGSCATDGADRPSTVAAKPTDSRGNLLVEIAPGDSETASAARFIERQRKRAAEGVGIVRLPRDQCFATGHEHRPIDEPLGTGRPEQYDVSRPPFERIMTATRDFLSSRHEEFQFNRSKRLFDTMRNAFGLRTDLPGRHWPGSGPDGVEYTAPKTTSRLEAGMDPSLVPLDDEVCPLLRDPESSVRGFTALLRREVEGAWDLGPSVKLATVTAAFFVYLEHYGVLSEDAFAHRIATATRLARMGPRVLEEAYHAEKAIAAGQGWNRASWTLWGGQYGGPERGGLERELPSWPVHEPDVCEPQRSLVDDWVGQSAIDLRPTATPADEIDNHIDHLIAPSRRNEIRMYGHIPFARRVITAVQCHGPCDPNGPRYKQELLRVSTAMAPWTDAEAWKRQTMSTVAQGETDDPMAVQDRYNEVSPLEREATTVQEPDSLDIWVERSALGMNDADYLVGMGLRGRWGLFGPTDTDCWWAFKAKDYVLPATWTRLPSEAECVRASPR